MSVRDVIIMGAGGRMGQTLCQLAMADPAFRLAGVVERPGNEAALDRYPDCVKGSSMEEVFSRLPGAVIVDFTAPDSSVLVSETAARLGNPVVIGTTGLKGEQLERVQAASARGRIFWSPNMSLGINALAQFLPLLVKALGPAYDMEIMEIHHNKKADSPSGTAIKLGQVLAGARGQELQDVMKCGREGIIGARTQEELGVMALRGGDVVGDHTVYFFGPGERIEVTHRAHTRENFARGALRAALWIGAQEPGKLYSMADMLA
ncbi:4-hydroxy-tetrahydrodipicolinate reductase [Fundidesulfovibrio magnetotacticus]|uniref:4-hydroxy-tetrahydrodipicolinate reductase n=1 Tax=Fundidesulfovibrio magnetotacticus TaxID=2730080 RepID=A0A6V8LU60_9BACT|nr:4-hydroxy-tetrahydrodipicolinate reductase [Fundidesulfovibrio magnetotacticus]GFK94490.1 4-hydroxy-tetrahydrodipicolinate reductase [Fundidesulfovibrio magnetotacticus]